MSLRRADLRVTLRIRHSVRNVPAQVMGSGPVASSSTPGSDRRVTELQNEEEEAAPFVLLKLLQQETKPDEQRTKQRHVMKTETDHAEHEQT